MHAENFLELRIQAVHRAVVHDRQGGNEHIRERDGHSFAEQMRRKITCLEPSGLSDLELPQSQEGF